MSALGALGMNKVFMIGQVVSQPRFKVVTAKDLPRLWFRLCTVDSSVDENGLTRERRSYHSVVVWGGLARGLREHVSEGMTVAIEGRLASRTYDHAGKSRFETEIVVGKLVMLDRKDGAAAA